MNIIWRYLDKRSATIAAIKDFDSMKFIMENTDQEIIEARDKMTGIGSPNFDGMRIRSTLYSCKRKGQATCMSQKREQAVLP